MAICVETFFANNSWTILLKIFNFKEDVCLSSVLYATSFSKYSILPIWEAFMYLTTFVLSNFFVSIAENIKVSCIVSGTY